ncbi:ArsB/NhaD family transporter [Cohnella zeiphila]|uniref:Arsenical efflux pump membrane protein ArsB n=1 Tax=Cohnella zeiphila TaxID=2761120 RepID=A0A7X0SG94_9BACL|nr:ArsB/NhaD family transporter [Cohnella zeiphila]MBB6729417.1 arsenical efflux pump membrane protein ArsB [Cohnella zeiphila]
MALFTVIAVFLVTMYLVIRKPRRWHEAAFAAPAAALLLAAGLIRWEDAAYIWRLVWNATLSLIGIMMLAAVLDDIGFFRWAALHIVRRYHHRKMLLLIGLAGLSCLMSTFFNNDGTVLIMTPIVLETTALLGMGLQARLAYLLAVGFMADTGSATLLVSNLTNILMSDSFGITFGDYARHMAGPGLVAAAATIVVLTLSFRGAIRRDGQETRAQAIFPEPAAALKDRGVFRFSWLVLALILAGYALSGKLGIPVSAVACGGSFALWVLAAWRGSVDTREVVRRTPWLIVVFALSMYLVVYGLYLHGATDGFRHLLDSAVHGGEASAVFGSGLLFSLLASVLNNLPAVLISSLSIHQIQGPASLPFAALIGLSIGAKLTPIGSLATLLWMDLLRAEGVEIGWGLYVRRAVQIILPVLAMALAVLWLQTLLTG